jgi:hypothetical protein
VIRPARPTLLALLALAGACRSTGSELTRWYARPPDMVSRIAAELLLDFGFGILSDTHDTGGAEIVARVPGPERRRLVARFTAAGPEETNVRVDLDPRDRRFGEELLGLISVRVGEESARYPPFVRASLEGEFHGSLEEGLNALDAALEKIGADLVERVVQPNGVRAEARTSDQDIVFGIAIVAERDTLSVQFTANAQDKESADRRVAELKSEFNLALEAAR